jgi:hypothetical protein
MHTIRRFSAPEMPWVFEGGQHKPAAGLTRNTNNFSCTAPRFVLPSLPGTSSIVLFLKEGGVPESIMNTTRTHAHWPGRTGLLILLPALTLVFLNGCKSCHENRHDRQAAAEAWNVKFDELQRTLTQIQVALANQECPRTNVVAILPPGGTGRAHCAPPHGGGGDDDTKLTNANLLTLLALLVALSAYLANVRRDLRPKSKKVRTKAKELADAELALATLKAEDPSRAAEIQKAGNAVAKLQAELKQAELVGDKKLRKIAWGLIAMAIADAFFIFATVLLGMFVLQQFVFHCVPCAFLEPAALICATAGIAVLILLHIGQLVTSFNFWLENK